MANPLSFTYNGHGDFNREWGQHRNVSDMWHVQGLVHELRLEEAVYGFSVSISRLEVGLNYYTLIRCDLEDMLNRTHYFLERVLDAKSEDEPGLLVDDDSILCGDEVQMLLDGDAIALRLRGEDFGLDLRLDRTLGEVWYGKDGLLRLTNRGLNRGKLYNVVLPSLVAGGKLMLNDRTMRVVGRSGFDRLWGSFPLSIARCHWERMYLFYNNGDELLLTDFPLAIYHTGLWLNKRSSSRSLGEYALQAVDYHEVDGWRFGCGWQLHIPEYSSEAFLLIPLDKDEYSLPVPRPILGIYDHNGGLRGYGFSGLMPGARNELKRVDPKAILLGKK